MVTPFKGRKLRKAAHRGRSKGLEAFQERYGASTVIDKRWLRRHRNEVRNLFYQALVEEITNAGLGLKEEEISTRVGRLADTVLGELKAAVSVLGLIGLQGPQYPRTCANETGHLWNHATATVFPLPTLFGEGRWKIRISGSGLLTCRA
jgi:hypothetical protein